MMHDFQCEVTVDGIPYLCEVYLQLIPGDDGIGAYEYWGAKGYDRQPCWELDSLDFEACDDEGNEATDPALLSKLEDLLYDKAYAVIADLDLPGKGEC